MFRHVVQRRRLTRHHVRVEVGRTPHGLTGVVDDEVEARARGQELAAERFDTRRVTKVEAEDLEAMAPLGKVGLVGVAVRRIPRKARRHDQMCTAAQQLEPGLVANLHAAAAEQRHPATEIGQLGTLSEIQFRA